MVLVRPLAIVNSSNAKWSSTQEKMLSSDYPFADLHLESPEQYVVRTYLQFLWLPESIMPLALFVPSIHRVQDQTLSSSHSSHPLHTLLDPLLLSTRSSSAKYHVELPQILANNGGAGEIEETMMWFALNYEKVGSDEGSDNNEDAIMIEEKWKNAWLERLERREVQIQILLYLLKLSLPGPCHPLPPVTISLSGTGDDALPGKKAKHKNEKPRTVIPSPIERLESFMDKLSMWQLVGRMDDTQSHTALHKGRDWMQAFCEDVVETQFSTTLPDMCKLLRRKLFPHSPFADDASDADTISVRSSSPPTRSSTATSRASRKGITRSSSVVVTETRARSRSLSVSLAQDASTKRSNSGTSTTLKRALSREVSMSRTFKPRPNTTSKALEDSKAKESQPSDAGSHLISKKQDAAAHGITLVAATPTKSKMLRRPHDGATGRVYNLPPLSIRDTDTNDRILDDFEADDEERWLPDSSPDILLLEPRKRSTSTSSSLDQFDGLDDDDVAAQTPLRKRSCC